ncbi:MAG: carbohydrate ABC transporter permease [Chloroflexi bacterium]|nr:carbohydrate ABC transporter permease [Chloroflexota bacterium]MBA3780135.1 carbohydrate ABC transporter permease [Chloroflexota bacterium]
MLYLVLILIALFFILPLVWMLSTSLKVESEVFRDRGFIPANPSLANFERLVQSGGQTPVFRWMFNSVGVATVGTILTLLLTSLSAYAFARIDFPFKNLLFSLLITTLLLPGIMFLVPQYLLISQLKLLNTWPAFMLPGLASVFGVFFMRQFFLGIPVELEEAAYVDGAGRFRTFFSVVLPLAGPSLATLGVITFIGYWNDYLWPLVTCQGAGCTLSPGLRNFQGTYSTQFGLLMAGAVLAAVPVLLLYIFAQRYIVQSVTSSGIKG